MAGVRVSTKVGAGSRLGCERGSRSQGWEGKRWLLEWEEEYSVSEVRG